MPGHKGRVLGAQPGNNDVSFSGDLTELPGLDDLSDPSGILKSLEERAAKVWGASSSIISVNGASAGLTAAILSLVPLGKKHLLVPRNAHRSIVNGLVLSGLEPIWYEPTWDEQWHLWSSVDAKTVGDFLAEKAESVAGVVVVSPTYGGAFSDLPAIARQCRLSGVILIVDEAHAAHLIPHSSMPPSAVSAGGDIVVQSLHKTLSALTQTGIVHIGKTKLAANDPSNSSNSSNASDYLRSCLRLVQTTSPSYLLLASIEKAIGEVSGAEGVDRLAELLRLSQHLKAGVEQIPEFKVFDTEDGADPLHVLIKHARFSGEQLHDFLAGQGIFAEAVLGHGLLLLLGTGSKMQDIELLLGSLRDFAEQAKDAPSECTGNALSAGVFERLALEQVMAPREAAMSPSHLVPIDEAAGCIAAECVAPCPPGVPLCVPGQRLTKDLLNNLRTEQIRVVIKRPCEPTSVSPDF